jgi:RES domain-containing protein
VILWRISNYATLDGSGGLHVSGRWHPKGRPVLYCSEHPAAALLETLARLEIDGEDRPTWFRLLKIVAPEAISRHKLEIETLPAGWASNVGITQELGNAWLSSGSGCLLEVPSVLVPETWNFVVNADHPDAGLLVIQRTYEHALDSRLF